MTRFATARLLALLIPTALMAGALGSQFIGGLYPCEMCHWQRWPHYAAIAIALLAFLVRPAARPLTILAALAIMASGAIGVFHAGVEYGWWEGLTRCSTIGNSGDVLADIMAAPMVRCDEVQWSLFGISLAGWNAIVSLAGGATILALCLKRPR
ncbi:disulfide bond formation protein B [Edaphosphingomonas haloaromaticamans]|uniref:Disulfide bond formation protein B n=1 Tax=Edaphosphingomonas haloaromaticamans TaxID=653954 RepID=A0A1S1HFP1_9SPHN|nr:disulfide bond formation protein B [Sphingomonas haloaromaticamans]OHT21045.1 Disulfide bond formation protein B [Sphingomonas haloaromaticamans]